MSFTFYDADDFHTTENKVKMAQGVSLSDEVTTFYHMKISKLTTVLFASLLHQQSTMIALVFLPGLPTRFFKAIPKNVC